MVDAERWRQAQIDQWTEHMAQLSVRSHPTTVIHMYCTTLGIQHVTMVSQSHKSHNAPVPYPTMHHSEQECAHFFCKCFYVGSSVGPLGKLSEIRMEIQSFSFRECIENVVCENGGHFAERRWVKIHATQTKQSKTKQWACFMDFNEYAVTVLITVYRSHNCVTIVQRLLMWQARLSVHNGQ